MLVMLEFSSNFVQIVCTFEVHSFDISFNYLVCFVYLDFQVITHHHQVYVFVNVRELFAEARDICDETRYNVDLFVEIDEILFNVLTES